MISVLPMTFPPFCLSSSGSTVSSAVNTFWNLHSAPRRTSLASSVTFLLDFHSISYCQFPRDDFMEQFGIFLCLVVILFFRILLLFFIYSALLITCTLIPFKCGLAVVPTILFSIDHLYFPWPFDVFWITFFFSLSPVINIHLLAIIMSQSI